EKFSYTREAMLNYMRALKDGGVLSVTLWNKEEPPKSVLKLYATMAAAAREFDAARIGDSFFVASSYLSTATVLFKRGDFTADEVERLRAHTRAMSFDEIYSKGFPYDDKQTATVLDNYRKQIFSDGEEEPSEPAPGETEPPPAQAETAVPATTMGRLAW